MDTGWYITQYACLLSQLLPDTHSNLHREQAQAEKAWVLGSASRWFTRPKTVIYLGTNRA